MPLLLRTAEQDRITTAQSWMSMALAMLALLQDDELALDIAFVMLLHSYMGLLSVSQASRRCAGLDRPGRDLEATQNGSGPSPVCSRQLQPGWSARGGIACPQELQFCRCDRRLRTASECCCCCMPAQP